MKILLNVCSTSCEYKHFNNLSRRTVVQVRTRKRHFQLNLLDKCIFRNPGFELCNSFLSCEILKAYLLETVRFKTSVIKKGQ